MRVVRFVLYVAFIFSDPPGWWRMSAILTSIRPSFDAYILTCPSIFGRGSALRRIRLKTAAVFGSIDCALQLHSASSTTPPRRFGCRSVPPRHLRSVTARGATLHLRLQTIFTLPFPLYPRHLRLSPTVSGPFPFQYAPKPPLAIPTRKDRHPLSVLQSAHCRHPPPSSHPYED